MFIKVELSLAVLRCRGSGDGGVEWWFGSDAVGVWFGGK